MFSFLLNVMLYCTPKLEETLPLRDVNEIPFKKNGYQLAMFTTIQVKGNVFWPQCWAPFLNAGKSC